MAEPNFRKCLEDALSKAFSCRDVRARQAYLDLAEFYERHAQRQAIHGGRAAAP